MVAGFQLSNQHRRRSIFLCSHHTHRPRAPGHQFANDTCGAGKPRKEFAFRIECIFLRMRLFFLACGCFLFLSCFSGASADAAADAKFSDVLHVRSFFRVVADAHSKARPPDAGKPKNGGSACGNRRRFSAGFLFGSDWTAPALGRGDAQVRQSATAGRRSGEEVPQ